MDRPLHILLYMQHSGRGGAERAALRLAVGWAALGQRVTLASGDDPAVLAPLVPGVELLPLPGTARGPLLGLVPEIRRLAPDIVFCAGNHYTSIAWWWRFRLGRRGAPLFVWKISNALIRRQQPRLALWGYLAWLALHPRIFDGIVTMTPGLADEAVAALGIARSRIAVIPNPALQGEASDGPQPPAHRFVLGVGRLEPQKDWPLALAAFAALADRGLHLEILGEGSERPALEEAIARLGLAGRVHLHGYVEGVQPWIARAEALLLTSRFEGAPNVVVEAVAAGTPVIATASSPALADLLPPDAGTITSRDPAAIAAALRGWLGRRLPAAAAAEPLASARAYLGWFRGLLAERG
jgi:glycosyltransferase involved in cell wall biosynthesis